MPKRSAPPQELRSGDVPNIRLYDNYLVHKGSERLAVGTISDRDAAVLKKEYRSLDQQLGEVTWRHPFVKYAAGVIAADIAVGAATASVAWAIATPIGIGVLAGRKQLHEAWLHARQEVALARLTPNLRMLPHRGFDYYLPHKDQSTVELALPGGTADARLPELLEAAQVLPGVYRQAGKHGATGRISPAAMALHMLSALDSYDARQGPFLGDSIPHIANIETAMEQLPLQTPVRRHAPELRKSYDLWSHHALVGCMGMTAVFFAQVRTSLAERVNDLGASAAVHDGQGAANALDGLAQQLGDPSQIISWSRLQTYEAGLPRSAS